MDTKFSKEDAQSCYWGNSVSGPCKNKPEYRVITLGKSLNADRVLVSHGPSVSLVCQEHMTDTLEDFKKSNEQLNEPVGSEESEENQLTRDYGLVIVPIELSAEDARAFIAELQTD